MGLFAQRQDDENTWAALPGEPRGPQDAANTLDEVPTVDPFGINLGADVSSIVFPVTPVLEDAASQSAREPEGDDDAAR